MSDIDEMDDVKTRKIEVYNTAISAKNIVYLTGIINEPSYYNELFLRLDQATEGDVFEFVFNTLGGNEDTAIQLYNAIKYTKATVIGRISGYCCSAGSVIFLACKHWVVMPHAKFMAHSSSGGVSGKTHETKALTEFDSAWMRQFFLEVYKGFFSVKEIEEIIAGKDFWLTSADVIKRLGKVK